MMRLKPRLPNAPKKGNRFGAVKMARIGVPLLTTAAGVSLGYQKGIRKALEPFNLKGSSFSYTERIPYQARGELEVEGNSNPVYSYFGRREQIEIPQTVNRFTLAAKEIFNRHGYSQTDFTVEFVNNRLRITGVDLPSDPNLKSEMDRIGSQYATMLLKKTAAVEARKNEFMKTHSLKSEAELAAFLVKIPQKPIQAAKPALAGGAEGLGIGLVLSYVLGRNAVRRAVQKARQYFKSGKKGNSPFAQSGPPRPANIQGTKNLAATTTAQNTVTLSNAVSNEALPAKPKSVRAVRKVTLHEPAPSLVLNKAVKMGIELSGPELAAVSRVVHRRRVGERGIQALISNVVKGREKVSETAKIPAMPRNPGKERISGVRLGTMKTSEVIRVLTTRLGCLELERKPDGHVRIKNPATNSITSFPYHGTSLDMAEKYIKHTLSKLGIQVSSFILAANPALERRERRKGNNAYSKQ